MPTPYDQEQDDAAPLGVLIEADSLEEADEKLRELGYEDVALLTTDDPRVQA
jgi:hypothetical protein